MDSYYPNRPSELENFCLMNIVMYFKFVLNRAKENSFFSVKSSEPGKKKKKSDRDEELSSSSEDEDDGEETVSSNVNIQFNSKI